MMRYPLIAPRPPRLSAQRRALRRIEQSGIFSNNGPEVRAFEADVTARLFGGSGASLAVANATLGLMVAIRQAAAPRLKPGALALMPALTFAATAQAAGWAGLTPLIADIDPESWSIDPDIEERLLREHGARVAVLVPYATFGNAIDLDRYAWLQRRFEVGVVIDAASSLGTIDAAGRGFGAEAPFASVFSMHATKTFAVAEGGLVHSGDAGLIDSLRAMITFGFEHGRSATLPGLNAKLPEVLALMARLKLDEIEDVRAGRAAVEAAYRQALSQVGLDVGHPHPSHRLRRRAPSLSQREREGGAKRRKGEGDDDSIIAHHALNGFALQKPLGRRRAIQFMPVLLPGTLAGRRGAIVEALAAEGIGCGQYFSPHLGEQPWFRDTALIEPTPVADAVAARMLSLPVTDAMTADDARAIAAALARACADAAVSLPARPRAPAVASLMVIGGGPAGTALLNAATKSGLLPELAASGLVMVERDAGLGGGRLGRYGITSDSTAETFLSAIKDNVHPELAALVDHPAGRAVARYSGALGVPLAVVGPLIRAMGERLGGLVERHGGTLLTGHEAIDAQQTPDGLWRVRLRRCADGAEIEQRARGIAIATGGHQPLDRLARQQIAGVSLVGTVGDRLIQSDEVLTAGGFAHVADLLAARRNPRVVVIGGSTSAIATVALLLKSTPSLPWGPEAITLLHRRPLRPFYPTREAAEEEGFTDFGPDDICPVSGFVYRLAGFRLEARELVLRMMRIDGRTPEPRVRFHRITGDADDTARDALDDADLVIAALGYRPRALLLKDVAGSRIALAADGEAAMVDRQCRIVGADGRPIANAFGIGLAAGFVPWGEMGGEASFVGQANGLWQWQNDVGLSIVDQVLGQRARRVA